MKILSGFIDPTRTLGQVVLMTIMLVAMIAQPAGADATYRLDVNYTNGLIIFGPLSFGLTKLPESVNATFILGPGEDITPEPGEHGGVYFDEADAIFGRIILGDATWTTETGLEKFSMFYNTSIVGGSVEDLYYNYFPINNTLTAEGPVVLNSPLTITGIDKDSGESFEYRYSVWTPTLTALPLTTAIDIKPGSDKNCLNINGHGVIPVAILGSGDFDVTEIDLASLSFGGLEVRVRGNKGPLCSLEYSNDDEYLDLVCHFEDDATNWNVGNGDATLTGSLYDGVSFEGTDSICIVP
ncbi:MAG: hypothetical protein KZQ70_12155 [gamma proteobacterium symbiont of Lucinoma myriamae]|nr:hypothetical protein [gamma proteobacterium symbiont of Lucinoma myriamae]MCU7818775.1 hypothetical protein [gamma proteobacterium symbiont of Lucinoma myriamae]